ncbi:hypothetical protein MPH_01568 [Macrophomina phaseolina MS6]|uniref:Uncharacterized protein n=1 Tax=Macrophomina phaseolina (strain MS6) TaxID=1126212 RepID=K2SX52_MACPH|nr:hypothetical protein MPH_01568 [Macrophomina phaseolina MS6]
MARDRECAESLCRYGTAPDMESDKKATGGLSVPVEHDGGVSDVPAFQQVLNGQSSLFRGHVDGNLRLKHLNQPPSFFGILLWTTPISSTVGLSLYSGGRSELQQKRQIFCCTSCFRPSNSRHMPCSILKLFAIVSPWEIFSLKKKKKKGSVTVSGLTFRTTHFILSLQYIFPVQASLYLLSIGSIHV